MSEELIAQKTDTNSNDIGKSESKKIKKPRTIIRTVLFPLIILVLTEIILLVGVLIFSNVFGRLKENAEDILVKQVQNRTHYLNSLMRNWANLSNLSETINNITAGMIERGEISLDKLENNPDECTPLILNITDELIDNLYSKRLTGIYVIFNTQDINELTEEDILPDKTGIYIRDMDPTTIPWVRTKDLLLARAPTDVCTALKIPRDSKWEPVFTFSQVKSLKNYAYFTEPMQKTFAADNIHSVSDYGYWGSSAETLMDSGITAITYSIPLVLDDGTVYGILGIDVQDRYLRDQLPYNELYDNSTGSYLVIKQNTKLASNQKVYPFLWNGPDFSEQSGVGVRIRESSSGYTFKNEDEEYFASPVQLILYGSNSSFSEDYWMIIGAVPTHILYSFPSRMMVLFIIDIIAMLVVGIIGSIIAGKKISAPVKKLSDEVAEATNTNVIPHLSKTGIKELDNFSLAFTLLSRDVVNASTRFLQIIHLASVEISGYEIDDINDTIYVTDNFFEMLGFENFDTKSLTVPKFEKFMSDLMTNSFFFHEPDGSISYKIIGKNQSRKFIRINRTVTGRRRLGIAEDITASTLERLRVVHERDHDLLTGLINRRAFYSKAGSLFETPDKIKNAALIMADTDSLKHINDNYGHECGDKYIRHVADCLKNFSPNGSICSRVSGDEFYVFMYGFETHEEVRKAVADLAANMQKESFEVPSGKTMPLSVSAGVSWYPQDSTILKQLMQYADFAMYRVKRTHKGKLEEFDINTYNMEIRSITAREEFVKLLSEERIFYFFQPIIRATDGEIYAYESLMRTDLPSLSNPEVIIRIAREENRLQDIEDLTWIKAPHFYKELLKQGKANPNAYLFINSIANITLSKSAEEIFDSKFRDLMPRIVTEITESDIIDDEIISQKRGVDGGSGLFALDDYGSGYNSERNLLALVPKFIKVDMSIIRDIDTNTDKQRIFANAVTYGHERNMIIVAEGVETKTEMLKLIELGADLLQGYLIGRPKRVPDPVPDEVISAIKEFWNNKEK